MRNTIISILCLVFVLVILGATSASAELKILVYEFEQSDKSTFDTLSESVTSVAGEKLTYDLTDNAQDGLVLDNTQNYNIIVFGTHAIGGWASYHLDGVEEDLIAYVEGGGFIYVPTSDDTAYKGLMFPFELKMRESGEQDFEVTKEGEALGIFEKPNKIDNVVEDDSYQDVEEPWIVLATSSDTGTPHTLLLNYGKGAYLVSPCRADGGRAQAEANLPFVENVLYYFVGRVKEILAVGPAEKLTVSWGAIKGD